MILTTLEIILIIIGVAFGVLLLLVLAILVMFIFVIRRIEKEIKAQEELQDIVDTREDNLDEIMRGE